MQHHLFPLHPQGLIWTFLPLKIGMVSVAVIDLGFSFEAYPEKVIDLVE